MKNKKNTHIENDILREVELYDLEKKKFVKQPLGRFKITKVEIDSIKKVEEDERIAKEKKEKEEKRILQKKIEKELKDKKNSSFFNKIKKKLAKFKLIKIIDGEDKPIIKEFVSITIIFGIIVNFGCFVIFGSKFNFYTPLGYGFISWIILRIFPTWFRSLWEVKK
jgi:hypothetical protein